MPVTSAPSSLEAENVSDLDHDAKHIGSSLATNTVVRFIGVARIFPNIPLSMLLIRPILDVIAATNNTLVTVAEKRNML